MTLLGVKTTFPALLWGICVLFAVESVTAFTPETSSSAFNAEPEKMNNQQTTAPVLKSADVGVATTSGSVDTVPRITAEVSSTLESRAVDEAVVSNKPKSSDNGTVGSTVINNAAAATSGPGVHVLHTSTAVTTAAGESTYRAAASQAATEDQKPTTAFAETKANSTASAAFSATAASSPQPTSTSKPAIASDLPSTTSNESAQTPVHALNLTSPSASTITTVTANAPSGTTSGFVSTSSPPLSTNEASKTSAELSATPQSVPATSAHMTTSRFSNATASVSADPHNSTAANSSTPVGILTPHEPTGLPVPTMTPSTTAVHGNVSDETPKTSTELSSTPPFVPATSAHTTTSQFSNSTASVSADPHNSTTANSSTPVGILIPRKPKRLPVPTMTTTAVPGKGSNSTSTPGQPCSTRGVVKNCLIVIAIMAALATIFMVSTITLCAKLSARKYKVKKPKQDTEMMCISSLLPDTNHSYTRQRNPVRNGILVFPAGGDSDEDVGDNLTLSSFLPDNDRYV